MGKPSGLPCFRIINAILSLVFIDVTAVQYNDPDLLLWVVIYGLATTACFLAMRSKLHWSFPGLLGAGCLAGGFLAQPPVIGQQSILGSEQGREMASLLLVATWMAALTALNRR